MEHPWQDWIGRQVHATDVIGASPPAALAATLETAPYRAAEGSALPPLWHWLFFLPQAPRSAIGPDGHEQRGTFLPPVPLPRRMWAAGEMHFHRPLRIGDRVARTSTVESVEDKIGRTGPLTFVRVAHVVRNEDDGALHLTEFHDIVYRDHAAGGQPARPAPREAAWSRTWQADDVMLFRYSALTFNGHRIHYDRRYVTEVEGYPGLVVHGPLVATLLADLVRERLPRARMTRFTFRALKPVFDGEPFEACGDAPDAQGEVRLWARDKDGALAMEASATLG